MSAGIRQKRYAFVFGEFRLDPAERLLLRDGMQLAVTPKVFETLLALVENSGHMLAKDDLMRRVWPDTVVEEANLAVNISTLRKVLGENEVQQYIETVPRHGYRFVASVRRVTNDLDTILLEEHSHSRLVVEHEVESGEESKSVPKYVAATRRALDSMQHARTFTRLLGVALVVGIGTGLFYAWSRTSDHRNAGSWTPKSIAVLPFTKLGAGTEDDYMGLAMADALITRLGNLKEVKVRPTSAVREFVDANRDPVSIGRKLGVEGVIDGSIQRVDDRVRLTVQLINLNDGSSVWTEKIDEQTTNILALEDLLSQKVAGALAVNLSLDERANLFKRDTDNDEAYQAYLLGRYFFDRSGIAGAVDKSISYYQQAIKLDPKFGRAYAGLADAYTLELGYPDSTANRGEAHERVEQAVLKALEIDDNSAEAHTSLARLRQFDWDWPNAEKEYQRAIQLDPQYASAKLLYGWLLMTLGRMDEALQNLDEAMALDPLSVNTSITIGACLTSMHRYDEAIEQLRKTIDLSPTSVYPHIRLAQAYELKGEMKESVVEFQTAIDLDHAKAGDEVGIAEIRLAQAYAFAGMRSEALRIVERWQHGPKPNPASYDVAVVYAGLGDLHKAFAILNQVCANRDMNLLFIRTDPRLATLRADPRYLDLMHRVGL